MFYTYHPVGDGAIHYGKCTFYFPNGEGQCQPQLTFGFFGQKKGRPLLSRKYPRIASMLRSAAPLRSLLSFATGVGLLRHQWSKVAKPKISGQRTHLTVGFLFLTSRLRWTLNIILSAETGLVLSIQLFQSVETWHVLPSALSYK